MTPTRTGESDDRRTLLHGAPEGAQPPLARRPCRGHGRSDDGRRLRGQRAAFEISWDVSAGQPRSAARTDEEEAGKTLRLHDPHPPAGRRGCAPAMAPAPQTRA